MMDHIPAEIVEKILLNLPADTLARFSSVSKSWRSMIFHPDFVRRHRGGGAPPGRGRMALSPSELRYSYLNLSSCPLSTISESPIQDARKIVCPIEGKPFLRAFCDDLWCVQVKISLFLWNPTLNSYKEIPNPSNLSGSVYGLGYDSVSNDYKLLKISEYPANSKLYSLSSDSWKIIHPLFTNWVLPRNAVFVNGAFYWIIFLEHRPTIVSLDSTTEKYEVVVQPPEMRRGKVVIAAVRGKLCAFASCYTRFFVWVMEDNGAEKSWTKKFDLQHNSNICNGLWLTPLYFNDDGLLLVKAYDRLSYVFSNLEVFMVKDGVAISMKVLDCGYFVSDAFVYVESLVSPPMWPASAATR